MPRITNSKIANVFSFSIGSWLNWSDEPAPNQQQQQNQETVLTQRVEDQRASYASKSNKEAITEAMIEHHIRTRARTERVTRREAMVAKLMQTAF